MNKDPAFLFYPADFLTGTLFMNNEQIGKYIKLLCAQHQHGGLVNKTSFNQIVGDDELLRTKFIETEDGFFNERLMEEMVKRERKAENLSLNAKKRWEKEKQRKEEHLEKEGISIEEELDNKSNAIALKMNMPIEDINKNINEDINNGKDSEKIETEIKNPVGFQEPKKPSNAKKDITYPPDYQKIWVEYGRKGSKSEGFNEYKKVKHLFPLEEFIRAVQFYKQQEPNEKFRKDIERFFKHRLFEGFLEKIDQNIAPVKSIEEEIRAIKEEKKVLSDKYPIGVLPSEEDRKRSRELNLRLHALEGGKNGIQ